MGEDMNEYLLNYSDMCNNLNLNYAQRLKYFHNLSDGEAKKLYCNKIQPSCNNLHETFDKFRHKYNSITHQKRIRHYLQNLHILIVVKEKQVLISQALEHVKKKRLLNLALKDHQIIKATPS